MQRKTLITQKRKVLSHILRLSTNINVGVVKLFPDDVIGHVTSLTCDLIGEQFSASKPIFGKIAPHFAVRPRFAQTNILPIVNGLNVGIP